MHEFKNIAKAFYKYGVRGFAYLWMRYIIAPKILSYSRSLERPITHVDLSIHLLAGQRDFVMALWSLASLYRVSGVIGTLYFHSDGTITNTQQTIFKKLFPSAAFVDARNTLAQYKDFFSAHPALKAFRTRYTKFQCKKLLDPYLASDKPMRLILDSDLLWFKNPIEIVEAVRAGVPKALMMSDGGSGFVYVKFKDGTQISEKIASFNSGIVLYRTEQFDLARFEAYLARVDYQNTRFTDQACYATILEPYLAMLPMDTYILKGTLTDQVVVRHYTSPQRLKFWFYGLNRLWREILS